MEKDYFLVASWKSLPKRAGSGSVNKCTDSRIRSRTKMTRIRCLLVNNWTIFSSHSKNADWSYLAVYADLSGSGSAKLLWTDNTFSPDSKIFWGLFANEKFVWQKLLFTNVHATEEDFSPQERTSSTSKKWNVLTFFYVFGSFFPS